MYTQIARHTEKVTHTEFIRVTMYQGLDLMHQTSTAEFHNNKQLEYENIEESVRFKKIK